MDDPKKAEEAKLWIEMLKLYRNQDNMEVHIRINPVSSWILPSIGIECGIIAPYDETRSVSESRHVEQSKICVSCYRTVWQRNGFREDILNPRLTHSI